MAPLTKASSSAFIRSQGDTSDDSDRAGGRTKRGRGSPAPLRARHTLNRPPMTERIIMAKTDTTVLYDEGMVSLMLVSQAESRGNAPAPGIKGGNDGLHLVAG